MAEKDGSLSPRVSDVTVEESLSRAQISDVVDALSKTEVMRSSDSVGPSEPADGSAACYASLEGISESFGLCEPKQRATRNVKDESLSEDAGADVKERVKENDALVIKLNSDRNAAVEPKEDKDSEVCETNAEQEMPPPIPQLPPTKSKNMIKKELRRALARERKRLLKEDPDFSLAFKREKRKADEELSDNQDIKKAKLETKALKAKRPGFSEERYNETSYFIENGLRKVYPYYFTFTTFTKGRWVGEKILDVFAKEFRAHPAEEYERCIKSGTLTVNYERVDTDCRLKHNDLLANIVHRHEVPVTAASIPLIYTDEDTVVVDKPASIPVHPCGRYRHNTVVFILAKEYNLKNLRTIHRLDRLTSGLLLFGRTPKKAREMEQQIRTRQVTKQYVCRVEGRFPTGVIECNEPIEVVSYKIGVCKVSPTGKDCKTEFQLLSYNGSSSVVLCKPRTGRMHQIRVHLQYLGFPIVNDPLYNHTVFGPNKGKGGITDKTDDELIQDLIKIHNAENWLGMDGDVEYSMFKPRAKDDGEEEAGGSLRNTPSPKDKRGSPSTPSSAATLPSPSPPAVPSPDSAIASTGGGLEKSDSNKLNEDSQVPTPNGNSDLTALNSSSPPFTPNYYTGNHNYTTTSAGLTVIEHNRFDYSFKPHLKTVDKNCYECKVRYRDPKPKDLVMFLHALKYSGPGWHFETKMPDWAAPDWVDSEDD